MADASLQPIYQRLNGIQSYHPYTANTFADWSLEAGDIVTVSRNGIPYASPMHSTTVKWRGKQEVSLESNGDKKRGSVAKMSAREYNSGGGGGGGGFRRNEKQNEEQKRKFADLELSDEHIYGYAVDLDKRTMAEFEVTAEKIRQEVTRSTEAERKLTGKIEVEAGRINQVVESVGADGKVTAASIALAINKAGSSAMINADKIYLLGETIARTVNADFVSSRISAIQNLNVNNVTASSIRVGSATGVASQVATQAYVNGCIFDLRITQSGNTYYLQKRALNAGGSSSWTNVGNFSRAVSSFVGKWNGTTYEVTVFPQVQTGGATTIFMDADSSWSSSHKKKVYVYYSNGGRRSNITNYEVDASSVYEEGQGSVPSYSHQITLRYDGYDSTINRYRYSTTTYQSNWSQGSSKTVHYN